MKHWACQIPLNKRLRAFLKFRLKGEALIGTRALNRGGHLSRNYYWTFTDPAVVKVGIEGVLFVEMAWWVDADSGEGAF